MLPPIPPPAGAAPGQNQPPAPGAAPAAPPAPSPTADLVAKLKAREDAAGPVLAAAEDVVAAAMVSEEISAGLESKLTKLLDALVAGKEVITEALEEMTEAADAEADEAPEI